MTTIFPRISGRRGRIIDLNVSFLNGGVPTDPYAIRYVEIYKTQVLPHNLIATIPIVDRTDITYPSPVQHGYVATTIGDCCTAPEEPTEIIPGEFHYFYSIPNDFAVPDVYFDVWYYFPDNPCGELGTSGTDAAGCDIDLAVYNPLLLKCCHRFWLYPDEWFCNDGLQNIRFGFEPLDQKFHSPEVRPLEVGLMPLPLYDYNFNLSNPIIPFLKPTITIETQNNELLVDGDAMSIGLRQGSYRSNPYVLRYDIDTSRYLKGTYQYKITLALPTGGSRTSKKFILTIS